MPGLGLGPGYRFGAPWVPNGFVDAADERAQAQALINPWLTAQGDEYLILAHHADRGDEVHEPNTFAFIPTEYEFGAALAVLNMQAMQQASEPVQTRSPQLAQLTQSLYQQAAALWSDLSAADTEGW